MKNKELAEELHRKVRKTKEKRKVNLNVIGNIWVSDLADMQLLSKFNKGIRVFVVCYWYW